jgi:hypothetical protein
MITPEEKKWVCQLVGYRRVRVDVVGGMSPPTRRVEGGRPFIEVGAGWLIYQRQAKVRATVRHLYPPDMPAWALADWMEEHGRDAEAAVMRQKEEGES